MIIKPPPYLVVLCGAQNLREKHIEQISVNLSVGILIEWNLQGKI